MNGSEFKIRLREAIVTGQSDVEEAYKEVIKLISGFIFSEEELDAMDRNARAYGWEIGRGKPLAANIGDISPDNPFINENWKDAITDGNTETS